MMRTNIVTSICALGLTLSFLLSIQQATAQTNNDPTTSKHLEGELKAIEDATSHHATDDELGKLWGQLASDYLDDMDLPRAEEAYGHALKLLHTSVAARSFYAAALDGLGSLYLLRGQMQDSENCRRKALAIFEEEGDRKNIAMLHGNLGVNLLKEGKYKDAENETSKAIEEMAGQESINGGDIAFAYLERSYARCFQHRCKDGLSDASRAIEIERVSAQSNPLQIAISLAGLGYMKWKTGDIAGADHEMREALRVLSEKSKLSYGMLTGARAGVLRQYQEFLNGTHREAEARQVGDELMRLTNERPGVCRNCTVNVEGLTNALH